MRQWLAGDIFYEFVYTWITGKFTFKLKIITEHVFIFYRKLVSLSMLQLQQSGLFILYIYLHGQKTMPHPIGTARSGGHYISYLSSVYSYENAQIKSKHTPGKVHLEIQQKYILISISVIYILTHFMTKTSYYGFPTYM